MILVTTAGAGSMDLYSRKLAENLDVPTLPSDIYQKIAELFNISWLSRAALRAIVEDWRFIQLLNRQGDVIHLPNHHLGRYGYFLKAPYIITVHDLIRYFDLKGYATYIHRPNLRDRFYLSLDSLGVRKAARIIAVSQTTQRDLVRHLGIPQERISVVYEGVDHQLFKPTDRRIVDYPYILFVGSEHPRKNFGGLLRAFSRLKESHALAGLKLVKVGKAGGAEAAFRARTIDTLRGLGLMDDVIFTEYVPEEDLPAYYSGATCLVFPSLYEGFGLPPLEAMACGCPVIISNRASLPEIAGGAALEVDPDDVPGLADALHQVVTDHALRQDLTARGLARAAGFSWEKTAEQTLQVYREVEAAYGGGDPDAPWLRFSSAR